MSSFDMLERHSEPVWQPGAGAGANSPTRAAPPPRHAPIPGGESETTTADGGGAKPEMVAASLGMGDYLPATNGGAGAESASGAPPEVLGRAGLVFAHDGGYSYRITADGCFEIVVAPNDQGVGFELGPDGEFASAWRTLCDYVVAMGPVGGAPEEGKAPGKGGGRKPPRNGVPWGGGRAPGEPGQEEPKEGREPANDGGGAPARGGGGGGKGAKDFLNQRDNEFDEEGCTENNQCTPTSATAAILGRMSKAAFYRRAQELLAEKGVDRPMAQIRASQPEDLVVEWMYLHDERHGSDVRGSSDNVIAAIEAWTGEDAGLVSGGSARERIEQVELPGVIGTSITGSGHTIELIGRTAQGILVNDPYGAARGKDSYLRHGESGSPPPAHRWSRRPDLAAADTEGEPREDWGRANFFTWDEVDELNIGKWVVSVVK